MNFLQCKETIGILVIIGPQYPFVCGKRRNFGESLRSDHQNLGVDQMSKFYSLSPEMATHLYEQNVLEQDIQQQITEKQS